MKPLIKPPSLQGMLMLPTVVVLGVISMLPFFYNIWIGLHDYYLLYPQDMTFIGLKNYLNIILDPSFWSALGRTVYFSGIGVSLELALGMGIALLLSRDFPGKGVMLTLLLMPMVLTPIAAAYMWRIMYSPSLGIINYLLSFLHIRGLEWTADYNLAIPSLILVDVWQWTPFMALILSAGLMSMPTELFEAAVVDGATSWQCFRHLILPLLKGQIMVALLIRLIDSLRTFDIIYAMTGAGPGHASETLNLYVYFTAFRDLDMGRASALGIVFLFIVIAVCTLLVSWSRIELTD